MEFILGFITGTILVLILASCIFTKAYKDLQKRFIKTVVLNKALIEDIIKWI